MNADIINVGTEKQLLMDNRFIDSQKGITFRVHQPKKTNQILIKPERPWEGRCIILYISTILDGSTFRMWYEVLAEDGTDQLCYAESGDGLNWVKPNLGLYEYDGSKKNNICYRGVFRYHGGTVYKDPTVSGGSEQYKLFYIDGVENEPHHMWVAYSEDGIHWQCPKKEAVMAIHSDTQSVFFWDVRKQKYVAYVRMWDTMRKVGYSETDDFLNWPYPEVCFGYDEADPEGMDFYTNSTWQYPFAQDVYLMFPTAFYYGKNWDAAHFDNLEAQLAISRDGVNWTRPDRSTPFIPLGSEGSFDVCQTVPTVSPIRVGNEIWIYYGAHRHPHAKAGYTEEGYQGAVSLAKLRLDGFISADAGKEGGTITTPPLCFGGNRLELNVQTKEEGDVRIAILDENQQPIVGFTDSDASPISGSHIRKIVDWRGKTDLSSLTGKPIRIRFNMKNASLYVFQFPN